MNVFCIVNQTGHLSSPTRKVRLDEPLAYSNSRAHSFRFTVLAEGSESPADLTGVGVTAQFLRSGNNTTVTPINGTVTGNVCEVILPASCYNVPGRFTFTMDIASNNESRTVLWVEGIVERNMSGDIIDPGTPVPNITAAINNANAAAEEANSAAAAANEAASGAANVNVVSSKTGNTITITTTDRDGTSTTTTVVEPTATVTKEQDGPYHLTVTDVNGTTVTDIPDPAAEVKKKANRSSVTADRTISGTGKVEFPDALDEPMSLNLKLEPKQDLHGYDKPWVGGSGKNLLPMKRSTETINGVTLTVNDDLSLTANGTATANAYFYLMGTGHGNEKLYLPAGSYLLSGCPAGGAAANAYAVVARDNNGSWRASYGGDGTVTISEGGYLEQISVVIHNGVTVNNLTFKPMLRLAIETDPTYEPYSNICPITGYDAVEVVSTGKNYFNAKGLYSDTTKFTWSNDKVTGTAKNLGSYTMAIPKQLVGKTITLSAKFEVPSTLTNMKVNWVSGGVNHLGTVVSSGQTGTSSLTFVPLSEMDTVGMTYGSGNSSVVTASEIQLELGSAVAPYEPFGSSISLNLASAAGGTVYGGTVTVNEDGSGELVVDKRLQNLGDLNWNYEDVYNRFYCDNLPSPYYAKGNSGDNSRTVYCVSDSYKCLYSQEPMDASWDGIAYFGSMARIYVHDHRFTDVAQLKAACANANIAYNLKTIGTYPLTASQINSLLGYTQVITDTDGALTVGYKTDKYAKLEKFLAALPSDTATGDPAVFTDGADGLPMKKLTVDIQPKQDLHGYDKPWPAGGGKNILRNDQIGETVSANGITWVANADGSVKVSGTATDYSDFYLLVDNGNVGTLTLSPGTYTSLLSDSNVGVSMQLRIGGVAGSDVMGGATTTTRTVTISESTTIVARLRVASGTAISTPVTVYPMLAKQSTALTVADYEPYSNICPISGWDEVKVTRVGKNLLDESTNVSGYAINVSGVVTQLYGWSYTQLIRVNAGGVYTFSFLNTDSGTDTWSRRVHAYDESGNWIRQVGVVSSTPNANQRYSVDFTVPNEAKYVRASYPSQNIDAQLKLGSAATAYEPYNHATLSVNVKSLTGSTVYGGTLTVNADGTGELVVDRAYKKLTASDMVSLTDSGLATQMCCVAAAGAPANSATTINPICSHYKTVPWGQNPWNNDKCVSPYVWNQIRIKDSSLASLNDYKNFVTNNDIQVCYQLTTPTTYTLTATQLETLLGTNTVWCDAGEVTVEYCADVEKYIEKRSSDDEHFPGDGKLVAGTNTQVTKSNAVATGNSTTASGSSSHAEGTSATASGPAAHAEGGQTTASGARAHAEGTQTVASGSYCHAEGENTVANHKAQHVFGRFNIPDDSELAEFRLGNYVEIVGNGDISTTEGITLSNARTLDWYGNEKLAGSLTIGMGTADEVTLTAAQLKALLALLS